MLVDLANSEHLAHLMQVFRFVQPRGLFVIAKVSEFQRWGLVNFTENHLLLLIYCKLVMIYFILLQ